MRMTKLKKSLKKLERLEDVTDEYYPMLNSFRADNTIKVREIKDNEFAFGESYYEIEKRMIKNNDERLMYDIELLEELEFNLRYEFIRIVRVKRRR